MRIQSEGLEAGVDDAFNGRSVGNSRCIHGD